MGYSTDFIGHIAIDPPLNDAEIHYLLAFRDSRHFDRRDGTYAISGNPSAEREEQDHARYNAVGPGAPSFWCQWVPCLDGSGLTCDGREFYGATEWMAYLINHFLAPGAHASESGLDCFTEFTFDHHLNGLMAACRRDTRRLYLIRVVDNVVSEETLVAGEPEWPVGYLLPYEEETEKADAQRRRRRRTRAAS